jgi:hypothetical protein
MAASQSRPGRLTAVLQRLKIRRLRSRIANGVDCAISSTVSLLGCLFAAEVAVGLRITRRDPNPVRRHGQSASGRETLLLSAPAEQPDPPSLYAARCVEIFGQPAGLCPDNGARPSARTRRQRVTGRSRCVRFPRCKHRHAASRCSTVSVQDWLKLHQPAPFRSRRHRHS